MMMSSQKLGASIPEAARSFSSPRSTLYVPIKHGKVFRAKCKKNSLIPANSLVHLLDGLPIWGEKL